jgi:signal peptidase II
MSGDPRRAGFMAAGAVLIADQLTKRLALSFLQPWPPVEVIGSYARLLLRFNTGAAFSISWGGPLFLGIFTTVAAVAVTVFLVRSRGRDRVAPLALGLILGGALGNLVDRALNSGAVIDFIDVGTAAWRWPTFNLADAAISIGGILLVFFTRSRGGAEGK